MLTTANLWSSTLSACLYYSQRRHGPSGATAWLATVHQRCSKRQQVRGDGSVLQLVATVDSVWCCQSFQHCRHLVSFQFTDYCRAYMWNKIISKLFQKLSITDLVVYPPTGSWPKEGRWAPCLCSCKGVCHNLPLLDRILYRFSHDTLRWQWCLSLSSKQNQEAQLPKRLRTMQT